LAGLFIALAFNLADISLNVDFDDVGVFGSWKQIKVRVAVGTDLLI
jgi:hypothetical protein